MTALPGSSAAQAGDRHGRRGARNPAHSTRDAKLSWARVYDRLKWALGVSLLNLFPLPREAGFRESFAYAGESVDRGYSVLVFPEGRHTTDGKMLPFRAGIGLLANNLQIPIVPVRIDGIVRAQAGREESLLVRAR